MQCASDPLNGELIDVAEYVRRHGQRGAGDDTRPACHCEVCGQVMRPRGELTPNTHAHFAHLRGAAPCPTQSRTGEPYLTLIPADPDPARAPVLKREVLDDWPRMLAWLRFMVPYFSPAELDDALQTATRVRLWEHRHLQAWQVPACLLVTRDFAPRDSLLDYQTRTPRRALYMRYWFASQARNLGDLWIHAPTAFTLVRGSYRPPTGRRFRPGLGDLLKTRGHEITPALAVERESALGAGLADWFEQIRRKHLP